MKGLKTILTDRCKIRKLQPNDADFLYQNIYSQKSLFEFANFDNHATEKATEIFVEQARHNYLKDNLDGCFVVEDKISKQIIGIVTFFEVKIYSGGQIFLDIILTQSFQNQGYGTHLIKVITKWLLSNGGVKKINLYFNTANKKMEKVALKSGFKKEGILNQPNFLNTNTVQKYFLYSVTYKIV